MRGMRQDAGKSVNLLNAGKEQRLFPCEALHLCVGHEQPCYGNRVCTLHILQGHISQPDQHLWAELVFKLDCCPKQVGHILKAEIINHLQGAADMMCDDGLSTVSENLAELKNSGSCSAVKAISRIPLGEVSPFTASSTTPLNECEYLALKMSV